jgi:RNase H-like domain found in reverse transcriptase/Integrase zinc binding domain/Integrase core domain/Zinc knuckle
MWSERKKLPMLYGKVAQAEVAGVAMEVEQTVIDILQKAVKGMTRADNETNQKFSNKIEAEIEPEWPTIWRASVQWSAESATAFDDGLKAWLAVAKSGINTGSDASAKALARAFATEVTKRLLDVWSKATRGLKWSEAQQLAATETEMTILKTPISGEAEEVRARTLAHIRAHEVLYGKPDTTAKKRLVAQSLAEVLHMSLVVAAPGISATTELLATSKEAVAEAMSDAAEKVKRATPTKKDKAAAPTTDVAAEENRERKWQEPVTCFHCKKKGHQSKDCWSKTKEKKPLVCYSCGDEGHFPRQCPKQTCIKCKKAGHMQVDCKEATNKGQSSKWLECVEDDKSQEADVSTAAAAAVEATESQRGAGEQQVASPERQNESKSAKAVGAVLAVQGKLDGHEARIGLDSFAGIGMVTAEAVADRRDEWRPSTVQLQGVAKETVSPLGEIDVRIQVGSDEGFVERAAICEHLPGKVDVLVSHDTLKAQGLQLSKKGVILGKSECRVVHAAPVKRMHDDTEERRRGAEKVARKMLRREDAMFEALESQGLIEEVVMESDGTCSGYRVALAEEKRQPKREEAKQEIRKRKRLSAKETKKSENRARKAKKRAQRAMKQKEWEMAKKEIAKLGDLEDQSRARMCVAAVETHEWIRGMSSQVITETTPTAMTVKAAEVMEQNTAKWHKLDAQNVLGSEEAVPETVHPDEYCVPELKSEKEKKEFREEFEVAVRELARKSNLREKGSKEKYIEIMMKHSDAYCRSLDDFTPGQLEVPELRLAVKDGPPIVDARRQLHVDDEEWLRAETGKFDKMGLWETPSKEMINQGLFVSNPVIVKTTDKESNMLKRRLTIDFWGPNSRIDPPPQRIPTVAELADRVCKAALFDKDDGISGYYQWKLHKDSKRFTAVYTPLGLRVFNCMPLGINVAPSEWNGAMAGKFGDLPGDRFFALMDDFLRFTPEREGLTRLELENEHLELLDDFLTRVVKTKLKLKLAKAVHGVEEIEALGMVYGKGKIAKTDWTTSVIRDYPAPTSGKRMERFLALGQYYAPFVEDYARLVAPLRYLQRKKRWDKKDMAEGSKEQKLFEHVRGELLKQLRLALPDWSKEFIIKSDFSCEAIGGALLQKDNEGKIHAVAFVSRKCTPAESKMGAADGEMCALVWVIKRFEKYLWGRKFTAYVDQGSLSWLKDQALSSINNRRLQGSFAYLRQFQFDLMYLKSSKMTEVDALSRISVATPTTIRPSTVQVDMEGGMTGIVATGGVAQVDLEGYWGFDTLLRDVKELQIVDDEVVAIRELMKGKKELADLEVVPAARDAISKYMSRDPKCENFVEGVDGRLYHLEIANGETIRQLYVPLLMRGRLVVMKHGSAASGHRAAAETLAKIRKQYFWPSMKRDIEAMIASCGCQQKKSERKQRVGELQSLKIMRPGEKVVFDIFGPLPQSVKGKVYLLVMIDVGTRELMLKALPTKNATGIAKTIFKRIYLRGMTPKVFQSDLAKEFVANVMKELLELLGAQFRHSSPYHPQTNTHVERYNKTIATNLSLLLERDDQRDWCQHLRQVEYAQLVGAQQVLGRFSPMFLKGGWEAMDPMDAAMGTDEIPTRSMKLGEWMAGLQRARQIAMQSQESAVARDAKRVNLKVKELKVDVGDTVWVMFPNVGAGKSRKLAFKMHGPYILREWLHNNKRVAELSHEQDEKDRIKVHVDRMVLKKDLPNKLRDEWKPLRMKPADQEEGSNSKSKVQEVDQQNAEVEELAPEVAKELEKELEDQEYEIEKILDHVEDEDGSVQYKVRFVGYGPKSDLWYTDDEMLEWAPELVADYEEETLGKARKSRRKRLAKEGSTDKANWGDAETGR